MPYKSVKDIKPGVRKGMTRHGADIFKSAFNNAYKEYGGDESKAFAIAHAAVNKAGQRKKHEAWPSFYNPSEKNSKPLPIRPMPFHNPSRLNLFNPEKPKISGVQAVKNRFKDLKNNFGLGESFESRVLSKLNKLLG